MRILGFALWYLAVGVPLALPVQGVAQEGTTVVYLVRHAERADDGTAADPPLSATGRERAAVLDVMLKDAGITGVFSTDFQRTQQTAGPVASRAGTPVWSYDARQLAAFADSLGSMPGRFLVTGHSNTTPAMVEALGGDPVSPIDEAEYDRLYVVVREPGRPAVSMLLRFGRPFEAR